MQTSKQQEILSGSLEKQEKGKFRRSKREFKIVTKERRLGLFFYIILFPFKWQLITFIAELGLTSYNSNFELLYKMRCVLPTSLKLTSVDSLI